MLVQPAFAQAPQPAAGIAAPAPAQQPQAAPFPEPQAQHVPSPPDALPQPQDRVEEQRAKPEGFFDALGRWFDKSARDFKAKADEGNAKFRASVEENNARWRELNQRTEKAAREAAARQKEAAEAFKSLANTRMIEGRQVCEVAPNGSPDCQAAAEVICKAKGFNTGKSADITTTRKCPARALLARNERDCRTETVVIKAACQ
ncbi:hypothetical protein [Pseudorhodoplanes sp.]|uniref:hypothetical protein n=1 Tax=Pseudorhodoplanes sp. TaxID=1934341 RepID=UPI00391C735E